MSMIKIIFISLILSLSPQTDFCEGWESGYVAGYCYRQVACVPPPAPPCPVPYPQERTFKDGEQRGFLQGVVDRLNDRI